MNNSEKKPLRKSDYLRQMDDEQLCEIILNYEETIVLPSCREKYCPYYEKNGGCGVRKHGKTLDEGCAIAIRNWLNSEVTDSEEWYK